MVVKSPFLNLIKTGAREGDVFRAAVARGEDHDLRHASAYLLYSVTNNLETVRNVLGHADPDMSMAYIGSNRRNQEAAINAVAQALGLGPSK